MPDIHGTFITKDSGTREQFDSGAKRDLRQGKGRFDLMPQRPLRRLAGVYERGAVKYGDHNWRKGMPFSRFLDSALRHLNQWIITLQTPGGVMDEDHIAQAVWNLMSIMEFEEVRPELNDIGSCYKDLFDAYERIRKEQEDMPMGTLYDRWVAAGKPDFWENVTTTEEQEVR